ncbi:MAG: response regulator transcription factor [Chloroflexota bacterium]|nr:response regulator transcription factor [Chloroflexota bacterium]
MEPIRVLIADDHRFYREGVRALLGGAPDIAVAGEAASGDETIARAEALQPDIILMDLKMPGLNGIEATRRILGASPHVGVLVVTMYDDDDSVFAAMRAGARGYLLKDADRDDLVRAIQAVSRGEAIFSPAIARRLMGYFAALHAGGPAAVPAPPFPDLTDREREILALIAGGLNNAAIAARLALSRKTVANHVSNILSKLQVADRAQAIVRARDAGLGGR